MRADTSKRALKAIAAIQVFGGILGGVMVVIVAPKLAAQANISVLRILPWLVPPFVLSLIAGTLLWRGGAAGEVLSIINLALQVPVLATPVVSYFFNAGMALRVWLSSGGPGGFVFFGSQFHINLRPTTPGYLIGVNLVAAALLVLLIRAMPEDSDTGKVARAIAHSA